MLVEEEESRWTAPLVRGLFQSVSSSVADGRGALTCAPFSEGPDLSVAPTHHYPASVAPAAHIRHRINASGGGDLVNPTAATTGHLGLDGKLRACCGPKPVGDKPNKSASPS